MRNFEGDRIIAASEMARIESLSFSEGHRADLFMQKAGEGIARQVQRFIEEKGCVREVFLLIGKGNNGGDAYAAGALLAQVGIAVSALHVFPLDSCSPLCREQGEAFQKAGGKVRFLQPEQPLEVPVRGVIVDGLVGTGFRGKAEGLLAQVIKAANKSGLPILAIDIPSGVNGDTGEVGGVAIQAAATLYLGLPKLGFFLPQGYDHIGSLVRIEFGLPQQYVENARAEGHLFSPSSLRALIPVPKRSQHKYSRGYVLAVAGSTGMTGAALMSCKAAMRTGAGIVRLFYPCALQEEFVNAPWELVRHPIEFRKPQAIVQESKRAGSLFFGPGMGKEPLVAKLLKQLLRDLSLPLVIDADGIDALAKISIGRFPPRCVLTPHHGELKKLLGVVQAKEEELLGLAQKYADLHDVTLVYKGAPTWIFHPGTLPLVMPIGDPGMAAAGSGDVLTGMIAALLAKGLPSLEASVLAVALHGAAGQVAAVKYTSHSVMATDLIEALPHAYQML